MDFSTGFPKYTDIETGDPRVTLAPMPTLSMTSMSVVMTPERWSDKVTLYVAIVCAILAGIAIIIAIAIASTK